MPKLVVSSPNTKSRALKELANELSARVGYRVYRVTPDRIRSRQHVSFLAGFDKVEQLTRFHASGVSAPGFARTRDGAHGLGSKQVVCRALTNSSEGRGITICNADDPAMPNVPLYTAYIPKKKEFRVHIWNNKVIDVQEKRRRRTDSTEKEYQVRNTANGYVFCRDNVNPPADCATTALGAVASLGRSYGAVDIIWNEKQNKCFVLEVNSRPGMQGTTVKKYADAIMENVTPYTPPVRQPRRVVRRRI